MTLVWLLSVDWVSPERNLTIEAISTNRGLQLLHKLSTQAE